MSYVTINKHDAGILFNTAELAALAVFNKYEQTIKEYYADRITTKKILGISFKVDNSRMQDEMSIIIPKYRVKETIDKIRQLNAMLEYADEMNISTKDWEIITRYM
jgi:flagellar motor switch protein FliM